MKKPILQSSSLLLLLTLLVFTFMAAECKKPKTVENIKTGYIMEYESWCGNLRYNEDGDSAYAAAYFIVSEDLQDTFETYNLSDYISRFPLDFFHNPENYRYSYKIKFEYEEEDSIGLACPAMYLWRNSFNSQIIRLNSLTLIQQQ
jgi:hypothetical protein